MDNAIDMSQKELTEGRGQRQGLARLRLRLRQEFSPRALGDTCFTNSRKAQIVDYEQSQSRPCGSV